MATADGARGAPPDLDALLARVDTMANGGTLGELFTDERADLAALAAACRALRVDAARLDWLDERTKDGLSVGASCFGEEYCADAGDGPHCMYQGFGKTLRAAIDAARGA